jgi:Lhr-like helicase
VPADEVIDASAQVKATFACFENTLETVLKSELDADAYARLLERVKQKYAIERNDHAEKAPFAMRELLRDAAAEGRRSQSLARIVQAIVRLRNAGIPDAGGQRE